MPLDREKSDLYFSDLLDPFLSFESILLQTFIHPSRTKAPAHHPALVHQPSSGPVFSSYHPIPPAHYRCACASLLFLLDCACVGEARGSGLVRGRLIGEGKFVGGEVCQRRSCPCFSSSRQVSSRKVLKFCHQGRYHRDRFWVVLLRSVKVLKGCQGAMNLASGSDSAHEHFDR